MTRAEELQRDMYRSAKATNGGDCGVLTSMMTFYDNAQYKQAVEVMGYEPGFLTNVEDFIDRAREVARESGCTKGREVLMHWDGKTV